VPIQKLTLYSVTAVWALVAVAGVFVLTLAPHAEHLLWLSVTLAAGIILTFSIQLGLDRKEGLVDRVMASLGGSLVLLAVATAVSLLVG
jgi:hypothetical protein